MKRKRFSEEKIIEILKLHSAGAKPADLCRQHGISETTQLANPLRRHGSIGRQAASISGGGEPEAEEASGRGAPGHGGAEGYRFGTRRAA